MGWDILWWMFHLSSTEIGDNCIYAIIIVYFSLFTFKICFTINLTLNCSIVMFLHKRSLKQTLFWLSFFFVFKIKKKYLVLVSRQSWLYFNLFVWLIYVCLFVRQNCDRLYQWFFLFSEERQKELSVLLLRQSCLSFVVQTKLYVFSFALPLLPLLLPSPVSTCKRIGWSFCWKYNTNELGCNTT